MIGVVFGAIASHWRRNRVQLAMLLVGLALATALWSGVQAINTEARAAYDQAARTLGQDHLARIVAKDAGTIPLGAYVALRRAGWSVSPVIEGSLRLSPEVGGGRVRLVGIEPLSLPDGARSINLGGNPALLRSTAPLFAAPQTATRLARTTPAPAPTQIDTTLPEGVAFTDIATAARILGRENPSFLILDAAGPPPGAALPTGLVLRPADPSADPAGLTASFHLNLTAFGFLAFAVGLFIVHSAIGIAFEQRRALMRTLRALGVPLHLLMLAMGLELGLLGLLGGLAGVGLGYGVAGALLPDVAATLRGLYGAEVPGTLSLRPVWWLAGLAIALAGTGLAGAQALWRLWQMPVLVSAHPEAALRTGARGLRLQALAGLSAALLGGAAGLWGEGLWAGFGLLAGLLLGAALILPMGLALALGAAIRLAHGVRADWFWADTRQQLPGLSLALMALMLALAANIGVGSMVASFRQTFDGWLDRRLVAEVYVTARSEAEADAMRDWLNPQVDAILPIWRAETMLAGQPGDVYAMADHATYRDHWPMLATAPDVWDRLALGEGVLINEQFWHRANLRLGAPVDLPGGALPVLGVYSDYGNPRVQVMIGLDQMAARFGDAPRTRLAVRVAPDRAPEIAQSLTQHFALPDDAVVTQAAVKAVSRAIFERTFTVTSALNVLTLGVAGVAMLASLVSLSAVRLPHLAPAWAAGIGRNALAGYELARMLALAALTFVAALPVGLALAWVLLAVINVEAFGWRLPMILFPADWLRLGALALLAAGLAALWPAYRLARRPAADLVKVFSNER